KSDDDTRPEFQKITNPPASFNSFEQACAHLRALHKLSGCDAMERARREFPAAYQTYQREGEEQLARRAAEAEDVAKAAAARAEAEGDWNLLVEAIREMEGCKRTVAIERARHRHPDKYRALQRA